MSRARVEYDYEQFFAPSILKPGCYPEGDAVKTAERKAKEAQGLTLYSSTARWVDATPMPNGYRRSDGFPTCLVWARSRTQAENAIVWYCSQFAPEGAIIHPNIAEEM
jgi:hypothetical protein